MAGTTVQTLDAGSSESRLPVKPLEPRFMDAGSQAMESLRQLAAESTYSNWEQTRSHMRTALLAAVTIYQSRGPPRTRQSAPSPSDAPTGLTQTEVSSSSIGQSSNSPTSPTTSTTQIQADDPPAHNRGARSSSPPSESHTTTENVEDLPSTPGGLVIPPFPPLDTNRRRKNSEGSSRATHILVSRPNGGLGHPAPPIRIATGNVFEDEYDEDVIIGGKKLAGWMDEEQGQKEAERLGRVLEELDEPPFTIQRLAELLSDPTKSHSSLGKFFRAVEKMLLVQTPWQQQTYVPEPETFLTSGTMKNYDPTLPPVMSTPKFSPIPWLQQDGENVNGSSADMAASVSPLLLAQEGDTGEAEEMRLENAESGIEASARSPTPEPEEAATRDVEMAAEEQASPPITTTTTTTTTTTAAAHTDDPGHQPYLGRVDELDTGPIQAGGVFTKGSNREEEQMAPGAGEGGAMTPHGMSEKPVPISSTTVISEEERRIAGLRQSAGHDKPEADGETA